MKTPHPSSQLTLRFPAPIRGARVLKAGKSGFTETGVPWTMATLTLENGAVVRSIIWGGRTTVFDGVRLCLYTGRYIDREVVLVGSSAPQLITELHLYP